MIEHFFRAGDDRRPHMPVSDKLLARFEKERGLRLPDALVELLKVRNGGPVRRSVYVDSKDNTYVFGSLPGIGEEQNGDWDLLERVSVEVKSGEEVSASIVMLYNYAHEWIALDYRESGAQGPPSVVCVDVLEPPTIIEKIAEDFDTFLEGLEYGEEDYYLGLPGVADDESRLVKCLERVFRTPAERSRDKGTIAYAFRRKEWKASVMVELLPNIDYAWNYDGVKCRFRAAGLRFPEFPECNWMLRCAGDDAFCHMVLRSLRRSRVGCTIIHEPRPEWRAYVVSDTNRSEPPAQRIAIDASPGILDLGGISLEIPPDFGYVSHLVCENDLGPMAIRLVDGERCSIMISELELSVNDRPFGTVKIGDQIRFVDEHTLYVNGEKRTS